MSGTVAVIGEIKERQAGTATRGGLFAGIYDELVNQLEKAPPEKIKDGAIAFLLVTLGTGSAISLADVGTDFFDFAIGKLVADMLTPLVKRILTDQEDAILRRAFRTDAPSQRILLQMITEGIVDAPSLATFIQDTEIKDAYLPLLQHYVTVKRAEKQNAVDQQIGDAYTQAQLLEPGLLVNRAESAAGKLEAEIDSISAALTDLEDQREVRHLESLASRIERTADVAEFGEGAAQTHAIDALPKLISAAVQITRAK